MGKNIDYNQIHIDVKKRFMHMNKFLHNVEWCNCDEKRLGLELLLLWIWRLIETRAACVSNNYRRWHFQIRVLACKLGWALVTIGQSTHSKPATTSKKGKSWLMNILTQCPFLPCHHQLRPVQEKTRKRLKHSLFKLWIQFSVLINFRGTHLFFFLCVSLLKKRRGQNSRRQTAQTANRGHSQQTVYCILDIQTRDCIWRWTTWWHSPKGKPKRLDLAAV